MTGRKSSATDRPDQEMRCRSTKRNPEGAAVRGKWGDPNFSADVSELNPKLNDTQFADYHGHGWKLPRRDLQARPQGQPARRRQQHHLRQRPGEVQESSPPRLSDPCPDFGMQCAVCHFSRDAHGTGHINGEVQAAIEITCSDCTRHGDQIPRLADPQAGSAANGTNPLPPCAPADGRAQFEWRWARQAAPQHSAGSIRALEWAVTPRQGHGDPGQPSCTNP